MNVKCPNCGTIFEEAKGNVKIFHYPRNMMGDAYLVPKEIRNDNIKKTTEYGKTTTEYGKTNTMNEKKENNTMMNNNMMAGFDMDALVKELVSRATTEMMAKTTTPVEKTVEVNGADVEKIDDDNHWAMTSKYKGKMICGYMFNPYMVRWFLQKDYMKFMEEYDNNISAAVKAEYDFTYTVRHTIEEIGKVAMLEKRDPIAYEERRHCFTILQCKRILTDYICKLIDYVDREVERAVRVRPVDSSIYITLKDRGNYYRINCGEVKERVENHRVVRYCDKSNARGYVRFMDNMNELRNQINNCRTYGATGYTNLYKLVNNMPVYKLPYETKKSDDFMDCFIRSGAYYTLKQLIMFKGYKFRGYEGRTAVDMLRHELNCELEGYKFHAMLKKEMGFNVIEY